MKEEYTTFDDYSKNNDEYEYTWDLVDYNNLFGGEHFTYDGNRWTEEKTIQQKRKEKIDNILKEKGN